MGWGSHKRICKQVYNEKPVKQGSKNISIKMHMLKDIGMTVPESRETSAAYILHLFLYFLALSSLHPSTYGNVFTPLYILLYCVICNALEEC